MTLTHTPDPRPTVFIDSSVLIAAAISPTGAARLLLTAGLLGDVLLVFSADVFEETERNLRKKYPAALSALTLFQDAFVDQTIRQAAEFVAAKDVPILAGALAATTPFLATFDQQHLLSIAARIRAVFGMTVATPSEILRLISKDFDGR
ncbi:MAG: PIN domain-containing protein [Chloroflexota bacterium]|nr:PIN domain-containing protein [Chloroflexota bacterium]